MAREKQRLIEEQKEGVIDVDYIEVENAENSDK